MTNEEIILRGGVTLIATFTGAFLAYGLQKFRENKKIKEERVNILNLTLFTLVRQINALENFKQVLDELENNNSRAFLLPPWKANEYDDLKFDFKELSFILNTEEANILHYLLIEQERFEQTIKSIVLRSEYQVNTIQPILENNNIKEGLVKTNDFISIIGEYKYKGIVDATDAVYMHVNKTHSSSQDVINKLYNLSKKISPETNFVQLEIQK